MDVRPGKDHHPNAILQQTGWTFLGNVLFPGIGHHLRWPSRLGARGLLAYATFNTLTMFAMRQWAVPWMKDTAARRERAVTELRAELDRTPTDEEIWTRMAALADTDGVSGARR